MDVVKNAKRPPKPQVDIDNTLWSVIEDCWSQEPSDRPTAETVSLRLHVNGYPVKHNQPNVAPLAQYQNVTSSHPVMILCAISPSRLLMAIGTD